MSLLAKFQAQLPTAAKRLLIAFSGGLDSTALLALCNQLRCQHPAITLRAIHIHHGLSSNADAWTQHCQELCQQWQIPLIIERLALATTGNIEATARDARYRAIKQHWQSDELLLTAHHLQDQSETFLLALKRGSGILGLSAMQTQNTLYGMPLCRPLLAFTRSELEHFVLSEKLHWIEDESNQDSSYERNFLRNEILPQLRQRWRHIDQAISRSAKHCLESQQLIEELLEEDFHRHCPAQPNVFQLNAFKTYSIARQRALLRLWLSRLGQSMPGQKQLDALLENVINAQKDSNPQWQLGELIVRRYQNSLYLTPQFTDLCNYSAMLNIGYSLELPDNLGLLESHKQQDGILFRWGPQQLLLPLTRQAIFIRFGHSGRLRYQPNRPRETFKKLCQAAAIPPWQRGRLPLIYYGETLQGILGLCQVFK